MSQFWRDHRRDLWNPRYLITYLWMRLRLRGRGNEGSVYRRDDL